MTSRFRNPRLDDAFRLVGLGITNNGALPLQYYKWWGDILFDSSPIYHTVDVGATSTSRTQLFNVSYSKGVCNLSQPGYIGDAGMWLTGISVDAVHGSNTAGAVQAGTEPYQVDADPLTAINDLNFFFKRGLADVKIGNTEVFHGHLDELPSGRGLSGSVSSATTASTTTYNAAIVGNGVPQLWNRQQFATPMPIYENDKIDFQFWHPAARTLVGTYAVTFKLHGVIVKTRN